MPAASTSEIESEIQQRGRELLGRVRPERLIVLSPAWWQERLMGWATSDPEFRVEAAPLRRCAPELCAPRPPSPTTSASTSATAYAIVIRLGAAAAGGRRLPARALESRPPGRLHHGRPVHRRREPGGGLARSESSSYGHWLHGGPARRGRPLRRRGRRLRRRCRELINSLSHLAPNRDSALAPPPNVSLKFSVARVAFRAGRARAHVARHSVRDSCRCSPRDRAAGVFVNVDMEQYRYKDLIHTRLRRDVLLDEFRDWQDVGIVVQAYLKDAPDDIERLRELAEHAARQSRVRLVKGAYWDEELIVAEPERLARRRCSKTRRRPTRTYERCTDAAAARPTRTCGRPSARTTRAASPRRWSRPRAPASADSDIEFQMLFGMAEGLREAVARSRLPHPCLRPGRRDPPRDGLPRAPPARKHLERVVVHAPARRGRPRRAARAAGAGANRRRSKTLHGFVNETPAAVPRAAVRDAMRDALARCRDDFGETLAAPHRRERATTASAGRGRATRPTRGSAGPGRRGDAADVRRAVASRSDCLPGLARLPLPSARRVLRPPPTCSARGASSSRRRWSSRAASPGARPTATSSKRSTTCAITPCRPSACCEPRATRRRPGRGQRLLLRSRAASRPSSRPGTSPSRSSPAWQRRARRGNCRHPQARRAVADHRRTSSSSILREAGVPAGVVQYLPGPGGEVGQALVEHPGVDVIAFTGSKRGRPRDHRSGAARSGPASATSSTSSPRWAARTRSSSTTTPTSTRRSPASSVRLRLRRPEMQRLQPRRSSWARPTTSSANASRAAVESLVVGPPHDPYTFVPPVISAKRARRIEGYIDPRASEGATSSQGRRASGRRALRVATRLRRRPPRRLASPSEEIFGPVLLLFRAESFDEALALALRFAVRANRRRLLPQSAEHRPGQARLPGRQPLHQPADHRRHRRPASVRRLRACRARRQGRRSRLPPPVHAPARGHREHDAARVRTGRLTASLYSPRARPWPPGLFGHLDVPAPSLGARA